MKRRFVYYYSEDSKEKPYKSMALLAKEFDIFPQSITTNKGQKYYYWIDNKVHCLNNENVFVGYVERDEVVV